MVAAAVVIGGGLVTVDAALPCQRDASFTRLHFSRRRRRTWGVKIGVFIYTRAKRKKELHNIGCLILTNGNFLNVFLYKKKIAFFFFRFIWAFFLICFFFPSAKVEGWNHSIRLDTRLILLPARKINLIFFLIEKKKTGASRLWSTVSRFFFFFSLFELSRFQDRGEINTWFLLLFFNKLSSSIFFLLFF